MSSKVAVIIPFFQEKPEILRTAVTSVLDQKGVDAFEILVVDDGSPVPANVELAPLMQTHGHIIRIIRQDNAGAGTARNTGLENVSADTEYVAFLDSDDLWAETHLQRALSVLQSGYDLYFANIQLPQVNETGFDIKKMTNCKHVKLNDLDCIYNFVGDLFAEVVWREDFEEPDAPKIWLQTVVYRYKDFRKIRFEKEFPLGEDILFLLELVSKTRKVCFSNAVECVIGKGVNIYQSSGWGSDKMLWREYHNLRFRTHLKNKIKSRKKYIDLNNLAIYSIRRGFVAASMHYLKKGKISNYNCFLKYIFMDPVVLFYFVEFLLNILMSHIRMRYRQE